MTKIYIDGILMDVDDKTGKIAVTYQNLSFLSLGKVKAHYTNRISLPLTTNNRLKLEQMSPLSSISSIPYENHAIRIVQNGIEIIPNGVCQITGVQDRIEVDVQSGIKGFFDALEGLYLNDIDLSSWNGLWDNDRHDTVRNTTSGLVCPVVNTGQLVDVVTYVDGYTYGAAMIPFFYYHTIIDQIFALVGYSKTGTIFSDTKRYLKMAMSTRLVYNYLFLTNKKFTAFLTYQYENLGGDHVLEFDSVIESVDGFVFNSGTNTWTVVNSDTALEYFSGKFKLTGKLEAIVSSGNLRLRINGIDEWYTDAPTDPDYVYAGNLNVLTSTFEFKDGDEIEFYIDGTGAGSNLTISGLTIEFIPNNTTNTDRVQKTDWYWYFDQLLPRFTLKEFIKDFMVMFGLVVTEKNNVVTFKTIEEILIDVAPTTTELSKENKTRKMDVNYNISGWSQENSFYWIVQDDEDFITSEYGKGVISVDNETIPTSQDKYTSIFTASDQVTAQRIKQSAKITIYNQATPAFTKAAEFGSRLLLLRDDDGVNFRFKSGTSRTDYFIGYFIDKNQSYSLDWQELIDTYYNTYEKILNNYAAVEQEFLLSQVQAVNMDLLKIKHKKGITYLVEQVSSFVPGKFAKFKMVRLLIGS
jgi:hypothetical protein